MIFGGHPSHFQTNPYIEMIELYRGFVWYMQETIYSQITFDIS